MENEKKCSSTFNPLIDRVTMWLPGTIIFVFLIGSFNTFSLEGILNFLGPHECL